MSDGSPTRNGISVEPGLPKIVQMPNRRITSNTASRTVPTASTGSSATGMRATEVLCACSMVLESGSKRPASGQRYHVRFENKWAHCVRVPRGPRAAIPPISGCSRRRARCAPAGCRPSSSPRPACAGSSDRNGGPPSHDGAPDAINAWVAAVPRARPRAGPRRRRAAARGKATRRRCCAGSRSALKDLYGVAGLPLTASSRVLDGNVANDDATAWARLRDQGMVLIGHTHTHEFAAGGTTDQVGNPWALDRVAGGSSGGSAAALAARMVPGGARQRHLRLAADPVGVLRHQRDQADARPGPARRDHPARPVARSSRARWRARSPTARRCSQTMVDRRTGDRPD